MGKERLVVSLTTIPSRLKDLRLTLESLTVGQARKPDRVYVTLPRRCGRGSQQELSYELPDFLQEPILKFLGLVELVYVETDLGPMTKLWGGLMRETDPSARIVVCDDDVVYGETWLQELETHADALPACAVGFGAFDFARGLPFFRMRIGGIRNAPSIPHPSSFHFDPSTKSIRVHCLMGIAGALYPRSAFSGEGVATMEEWSRHPRMRRADDVTISAWLSIAGVPRYLVQPSPELDRAGEDRGLIDALSTSWMYAVYNHAFAYATLQKSHNAFRDRPQDNQFQSQFSLWSCWAATIAALAIAAILLLFLLYTATRRPATPPNSTTPATSAPINAAPNFVHYSVLSN